MIKEFMWTMERYVVECTTWLDRWLDMLVGCLNVETLLLNQQGWVVSVHLRVQQQVGQQRVAQPACAQTKRMKPKRG